MTLLNRIPILQIPHSPNGQVAQLVERGPEKAGVGGSIPSLATINFNNLAIAKSDSLLFHGGDTGSTPIRDVEVFKQFRVARAIIH